MATTCVPVQLEKLEDYPQRLGAAAAENYTDATVYWYNPNYGACQNKYDTAPRCIDGKWETR